MFATSLSFSLYYLAFDRLLGNSRGWNLSPPILWYNKKIHAKKKSTKKSWFSGVLSSVYGHHSVTATWAIPSPCSIWCNSTQWLLSFDTILGETRRDETTRRDGKLKIGLTQFNCNCNCLLELSLAKKLPVQISRMHSVLKRFPKVNWF